MNRIGIDLGGTKIEGILTDENYKTITRKRIPTNQEEGYNSILESIKNLILELVQESNEKVSVGVCTPGALSLSSGLIKNSNTQCLIGKDLQSDLKNILHYNVSIENDANCFALAEAKLGAGKNSNLVFGVIMGTGVGGGIIIDGKIHHGRTNIAGEWGHHCLHPEGNICYCGNKGCVETYISGPALEKKWSQLTSQNQSLPEIIKNLDNPNFVKIGGKTGTAELINEYGLYQKDENLTSFIGVFPTSKPKYIVLAMIENPKKDFANRISELWI